MGSAIERKWVEYGRVGGHQPWEKAEATKNRGKYSVKGNWVANGHRGNHGENLQENCGCYPLAPEICKQKQGVCKRALEFRFRNIHV